MPSKRFLALALVSAAGVCITACSRHEPRACEAPRSYWQKPHNFGGIEPLITVVALAHGGLIYWNGTSVSPAKLSKYLKTSHLLNPEPQIFLETEVGVSCRNLEAVRDQMDRTLECRKPGSRCSEGIRSVWEDLPSPPGSPIS